MSLKDRLQEWYRTDVVSHKIQYLSDSDPTISVNPDKVNVIWYNRKSGEIFICIDNTPNKNIWRGTSGKIIAPSTLSKFDFFEDGSTLLVCNFDGNVKDLGGKYNGQVQGRGPLFDLGRFNQALKSRYNHYNVRFHIPELKSCTVVTVSAWILWEGHRCCVMPFGFARYDVYTCCNRFGFNTGHADIYGFNNAQQELYGKWIHIVAEFHKGEEFYQNKIWINGEQKTLRQELGTPLFGNADFGENFYVFGWGANRAYRHFGRIDQIRLFNRALTDTEVKALYQEH